MPQNLVVRTSNSTRPVLELLLPGFERACGCTTELIVDSTKNSLDRIEKGERGDAAVLQDVSIRKLVAAGILSAPSCQRFGESRIGLGRMPGAESPDISTVERFTAVLLNASSIAHTEFGPSGRYFPELVEQLGLTAQLQSKMKTRPGGYIGYAVTDGEAELAFQQICELLVVPGLEIIGPIPNELQRTIWTEAAIFNGTSQPELAAALLQFLSRPANLPLFQQTGLEMAK